MRLYVLRPVDVAPIFFSLLPVIVVEGMLVSFSLSYFSFVLHFVVKNYIQSWHTTKRQNISSFGLFERLLLVYEHEHCLNNVIEAIKYDLRQYLNRIKLGTHGDDFFGFALFLSTFFYMFHNVCSSKSSELRWYIFFICGNARPYFL